jgi:RNA polymerase sigma factor (sigma-70 family)
MSESAKQAEFTLWLSHRQRMLIKTARAICFDSQNAEDVLQETLIDVYQKWEKVRTHENPEAYVIRVMISKHVDLRRKWARKRQEKETTLDLPQEVLQIADQSDDVLQRLLVQSALKSLTPMQRAVLVLTYEYGFLLREVAQVLEIPLGTAASHLARGKAAVAAHIELIPALEKSSTQALQAPKDPPKAEEYFEEEKYVDNVELAEVIEND